MIILIILGAIFLAVLITMIVLQIVAKKIQRDNWILADDLNEASLWLLLPLVIVMVGLITASSFAIAGRAETLKEHAYITYQTEYEILMYRIENQKDHVLEDTELYNAIVEYNTTIRYEQKLIKSKWVGIFHDQSIAKCKEIDLSAFSKEVQNAEDKG